jgi:hypothetical protein
MKPEWRTQTVIALCQAMRQERDYSALPILADALQDADYADEEILATMRSGPDKIEAQRLVALIYSAETAAAVKRIESIATTLGDGVILELGGEYVEGKDMSYSTLIDVANRWLDSEDSTTGQGSANWTSDFFRVNEFWESYEMVTGRKPDDPMTSPFSCIC